MKSLIETLAFSLFVFHFLLFEKLLKKNVIKEIRIQGFDILPFVEWSVRNMSVPKLISLFKLLRKRRRK